MEYSPLQGARDMRERPEPGEQLGELQQEPHSSTPALTEGRQAGSNGVGQVPQGVVLDGRVDGKAEPRLSLLGKGR